MRNKIIKILREMESESGFTMEHSNFDEDFMCDYLYEDYLPLPNYKLLIQRLNNEYPVYSEGGLIIYSYTYAVERELKRMELDGLVLIGEQNVIRQARTSSSKGPDFDNVQVKTESITLTTKGKSSWRYFLYQTRENPFGVIAIFISIASLIISIISLNINK